MTPLVDVMLVLLVIFLVTAPMLNNAIKLELPTDSAAQVTEEKSVTISINKSGEYFLDETAVSNSALDQKLIEIGKNNPNTPIHLRADVDVSYGKVSHVLAVAQKNGLNNIGFITQPK